MCFLGLKRLVEPFYNGYRGTPFWEDYPANYPLAQQVYDQGGAVTYAHPGMAPNLRSGQHQGTACRSRAGPSARHGRP